MNSKKEKRREKQLREIRTRRRLKREMFKDLKPGQDAFAEIPNSDIGMYGYMNGKGKLYTAPGKTLEEGKNKVRKHLLKEM